MAIGVPERVSMKLADFKTASLFARYNVVVGVSDFKDAATRLDADLDRPSRGGSHG